MLQGASLQTRSRAVQFQDLNLMTEDGVRTLYNRLSGAARHVCGTRESRDLVRLSDWKSCYSNALDQAINDLNHPLVNALHAARDGARTRNHFAIPSGNFGRPSTAAP